MYACLGKTRAKTHPSCQYRIISILQKQVVKQVVREKVENSEIVAICNRYKNTLDDLIDSSDPESPD